MAVHTISNHVSQRFTTADGRKELMRNFVGTYSGTNSDEERVLLIICPTSLELTTFQSNGWVRINWYDADGLATGEAFDSKWC